MLTAARQTLTRLLLLKKGLTFDYVSEEELNDNWVLRRSGYIMPADFNLGNEIVECQP